MLSIELQGEEIQLLGERVIFWPKKNLLLLADLHLGKVNHFRRSGIAVPHKANDKNTESLISLLQDLSPDRVIFLGDLFHSHYNAEWEVFGQVLRAFPQISFELVIGNHDILGKYQYDKHAITVHRDPLVVKPFLLSHEPLEERHTYYNLAGHIHPAVMLEGKARQRLKLPCFYFKEYQGLLPAFGVFTGMHVMQPSKGEHVYVLVDGQVVKV